ncbi:hypothetical protein BU23DRAFT_36199 [Bimuria novae-zelandiae CBS 107.79]|uniref:Uncharacterized protein n=1 Tax=Bimuria novae-zelandiae CBS 107.79 TaxID=1447943 RepID=A0A6A5UIS8_9PLEO|nr:hypothetical protein BU23DRAFT_36199 [Bimuria novae-zelandiae CBS 107.79]
MLRRRTTLHLFVQNGRPSHFCIFDCCFVCLLLSPQASDAAFNGTKLAGTEDAGRCVAGVNTHEDTFLSLLSRSKGLFDAYADVVLRLIPGVVEVWIDPDLGDVGVAGGPLTDSYPSTRTWRLTAWFYTTNFERS